MKRYTISYCGGRRRKVHSIYEVLRPATKEDIVAAVRRGINPSLFVDGGTITKCVETMFGMEHILGTESISSAYTLSESEVEKIKQKCCFVGVKL